jgi:hypothetical protein
VQRQDAVLRWIAIKVWRRGDSSMSVATSTIIPQNFPFQPSLLCHAQTPSISGAIALALTVGALAAFGIFSKRSPNIRRPVGWIEHTIWWRHTLRPRLFCAPLTGHVGEPAALLAVGAVILVRKPVSVQASSAHIEADPKAVEG